MYLNREIEKLGKREESKPVEQILEGQTELDLDLDLGEEIKF